MSTTTRPPHATAPADEPAGGSRDVVVPRAGSPSVPAQRLTSVAPATPRPEPRGPRPPGHARARQPGAPLRFVRAAPPVAPDPARGAGAARAEVRPGTRTGTRPGSRGTTGATPRVGWTGPTGATPALGVEAVESAARARALDSGSWGGDDALPRPVRRRPALLRAVRALGSGRRSARTPAPHRAPWTPANLARVPRTWRQRLVTAVAWSVVVVCGTAYAVSLLVPLWFQLQDQRVLIVTSGSMSGTEAGGFDAGDAVIMRRITDPSQLRVGQVVSFWPPGSDALVTHRIVALHYLPVLRQDEATGRMLPTRDPVTGELVERPFIVTKGDANPDPDPDATPLQRVRGVVLDVYPGWGWVLAWARSAQGRFVMLVPPLVALAVMEVQSLLDSRRTPRPPRHRGKVHDDLLLG